MSEHDDTEHPPKGERIAKVLARAGICSRRDAERMIADGRVQVDGITLESPAFNVTPEKKIRVDGKLIRRGGQTRLWRYYKPTGLVTTHKDPEGRPTVFEAVEKIGLPRVISVGRLDVNSEGLLLLTNDGELARKLELPSSGLVRRYRVRVHGRITQNLLDSLARGVVVEGIRYGSVEAEIERDSSGSNTWLIVALREGKNREIRHLMEHLGVRVNRLVRLSYGPLELDTLKPGDIMEVTDAALLADAGLNLSVKRENAQLTGRRRRPLNVKGGGTVRKKKPNARRRR